jgi:ParB family chromosome partitioning protein
MASKRKGLGRGLDALLSGQAGSPADAIRSATGAHADAAGDAANASLDGKLAELPIEFLQRGKYQPRRDMHQEALQELADSIKAQGVMQPIVVRPTASTSDDKRYEIIAGERRWRASQLAGLDRIPVVIRDVSDEAAIAMALIENLQREDLNPIEEAMALKRLQDEFELTHQEVANAVGKSRAAVTNSLRLLNLTDEVRTLLEHGDLEMGHARCLLSLPAELQCQVARQIVAKGLSVRQAEALARVALQVKQDEESPGRDPDIQKLEERLAEHVGVPVNIQHSAKGKGKLILKYNNLDELDGILNHLRYEN